MIAVGAPSEASESRLGNKRSVSLLRQAIAVTSVEASIGFEDAMGGNSEINMSANAGFVSIGGVFASVVDEAVELLPVPVPVAVSDSEEGKVFRDFLLLFVLCFPKGFSDESWRG